MEHIVFLNYERAALLGCFRGVFRGVICSEIRFLRAICSNLRLVLKFLERAELPDFIGVSLVGDAGLEPATR